MQLSCLSPVPPFPTPLAVTPPPLCHAPRHCHGKWPPHGKCNIRNVSVRLISALGVFLFVSFAIPLPSLLLSLSICLFLVTLFGQLIMHKMHWQQQIDKGSDALRAPIGSFLPEPRLVLSQRDACVNRQLYPRYCLFSRSGSSDFSTRSLIKSDATKRERDRGQRGDASATLTSNILLARSVSHTQQSKTACNELQIRYTAQVNCAQLVQLSGLLS